MDNDGGCGRDVPYLLVPPYDPLSVEHPSLPGLSRRMVGLFTSSGSKLYGVNLLLIVI